MTDTATVFPFHRHEPAVTITKKSGVKIESVICPCRTCGKVMEFVPDLERWPGLVGVDNA